MDETNPTNQEGDSSNQAEVEGQKLEKLEREIEELEKKAAAPPAEPTPPPTPHEPAPPVTGKSKVVLWVSLGLLLLALVVAGAYSLGSRKVIPTPTPASTPSPVETLPADETIGWTTYENKKFGFSLKYPAELNVEAREIDIQADHRKYIKDCETGVYDGCGGGAWPEYQVSFMRPNGKSAFDVKVFMVRAGEYFGGKESVFTYKVRTAGLFGQTTKYEPVEEEIASKIEETIEFISPDRPTTCLWTDEFVGVDINKPGTNKGLYSEASGYFYNREKDSCQTTEIFVWARGGFTAQEEANIPFQTIDECTETCVGK